MYDLLVKLMVVSAFLQLGWNSSELKNCRSRECLQKLEKKSRDILKVDWKPISIFPEEAKRFR